MVQYLVDGGDLAIWTWDHWADPIWFPAPKERWSQKRTAQTCCKTLPYGSVWPYGYPYFDHFFCIGEKGRKRSVWTVLRKISEVQEKWENRNKYGLIWPYTSLQTTPLSIRYTPILMTSSGSDILVRSSFHFNPRQELDVETARYHQFQPSFQRSTRFPTFGNHPT